MSDCRFGVSPVNYPDPDPAWFYVKYNVNKTRLFITDCICIYYSIDFA